MTRLDKKLTFKEKDTLPQSGLFGLMDSAMLKVFRIEESEQIGRAHV